MKKNRGPELDFFFVSLFNFFITFFYLQGGHRRVAFFHFSLIQGDSLHASFSPPRSASNASPTNRLP